MHGAVETGDEEDQSEDIIGERARRRKLAASVLSGILYFVESHCLIQLFD